MPSEIPESMMGLVTSCGFCLSRHAPLLGDLHIKINVNFPVGRFEINFSLRLSRRPLNSLWGGSGLGWALPKLGSGCHVPHARRLPKPKGPLGQKPRKV